MAQNPTLSKRRRPEKKGLRQPAVIPLATSASVTFGHCEYDSIVIGSEDVWPKQRVPSKNWLFYYPNPMWYRGDWVKNLILFFDGIALLVPNYMKRRPEEIDPAIVVGLKEHGLLYIIEPEKAVDKAATEKLATALASIITSGVLDHLAKENTPFHELSMSRLGYYGDENLANMIFKELKKRKLAKDSEDKVSIPMHPMVRSLILVLLAQILRRTAQR